MKPSRVVSVAVVTLAIVFTSAGCATKKYVRNTVAPINTHVAELDKKTADNTTAIGEVEKSASRADEHAMTADGKAAAAAQEAAKANDQATQAGRAADNAKSLAEQGLSKVTAVERTVENLDNYKMITSESVLFAFGKSELSEEAKAQLDTAVKNMSNLRHFVIEVQGFTDKTGAKDYNLELSRRRAASVVRYLTVTHKIPLHRIHTLGYGPETPVADNSTRAGRKLNRRVEVRFFGADMAAGGNPMAAKTTDGSD